MGIYTTWQNPTLEDIEAKEKQYTHVIFKKNICRPVGAFDVLKG